MLLTPTLVVLPQSCKAEGRREIQPGSAEADAVCGPHVSGEKRGKVKKKVLLAAQEIW